MIKLSTAAGSILPNGMLRRLTRLGAYAAQALSPERNGLALRNIANCFPGKYSPAAARRLVKNIYQHYFSFPTDWRDFQNGRLQICFSGETKTYLDNIRAPQRPALLMTGHFGNFEMAYHTLLQHHFPLHIVTNFFLIHFEAPSNLWNKTPSFTRVG